MFVAKLFVRTALVAFLSFLILPAEAHAYLDPGTGSYFLQILLAGILGGLYALKLSWHRIVALFRRSRPAEDKHGDAGE